MLDRKEMTTKVAAYDKTACMIANALIERNDVLAKIASQQKTAEPVVAPSNAYFNTAADMVVEAPNSQKRVLTGAGVGLLAGLIGGALAGRPRNAKWNDMRFPRAVSIPMGGVYGAGIGALGMGLIESLRLSRKAKESVEKYRAAENQQTAPAAPVAPPAPAAEPAPKATPKDDKKEPPKDKPEDKGEKKEAAFNIGSVKNVLGGLRKARTISNTPLDILTKQIADRKKLRFSRFMDAANARSQVADVYHELAFTRPAGVSSEEFLFSPRYKNLRSLSDANQDAWTRLLHSADKQVHSGSLKDITSRYQRFAQHKFDAAKAKAIKGAIGVGALGAGGTAGAVGYKALNGEKKEAALNLSSIKNIIKGMKSPLAGLQKAQDIVNYKDYESIYKRLKLSNLKNYPYSVEPVSKLPEAIEALRAGRAPRVYWEPKWNPEAEQRVRDIYSRYARLAQHKLDVAHDKAMKGAIIGGAATGTAAAGATAYALNKNKSKDKKDA